MIETYSTLLSRHIDRILAAAPARAKAEEKEFVRAFYAFAPVADLAALDPAEAYGLASEAYAFTAIHKGPEAHVSVESIARPNAPSVTRIMTITEDKPFLVDSLLMLMHRIGLRAEHTLHPILTVKRDAKGKRLSFDAEAEAKKSERYESIIVMQLSSLPSGMRPQDLEARIRRVLARVSAASGDWATMRKATLKLAAQFERPIAGLPKKQAAEIASFIRWLEDKHFVFLGMKEYSYDKSGSATEVKDSGLGIYALPPEDAIADHASPIEYGHKPLATHAVDISKSSEPSEVHRAVPMDLITLRRYDAKGKCTGEVRLLGLFTSNVYYQTTDAIPLLRNKVSAMIDRSGFDPVSHNGKSLKAILEFLPRDELFQLDDDALFTLAMGVLSLESRPKVRLFTRLDHYERYASCLVYIPRERFSTTLREQIERLLARAYKGRSLTFYTLVSDSPLARVNILISTNPGDVPSPDIESLENEITALASVWLDALRTAFVDTLGPARAESTMARYRDAFPGNYISEHTGFAALCDTRRIEEALSGDGLALELYHRRHKSDDIHLKCYVTDTDSTLSDVVPILENMGAKLVEVRPYLITPKDAPTVLIRDFLLRIPGVAALDLDANKDRIQEAIGSIWRRRTANDQFNGLLFKTGLTVRQIDHLRIFSRYLRQANFTYGQVFVARALCNHPELASLLAHYFDARFNPAMKSREIVMEERKQAILSALESVENLAEDRVIRRFLELMEATLRTNAYQRDAEGNLKSSLSIKLRSSAVPELPLPRPYAEIFVYSMRTEGIHLRGDRVARGGLRWSDRPEDFRTEVLGLMKAQMVKNAVIVPSGSKGGFIVKRPTKTRDELQAEGIECYKEFLRGLLDLTDNISGTKVIPPKDVVRHDNDDPYLVVAADKGTASFSDIANGVSAEYGFWLGDAFASGGSAGYDHKEMAITARGGWVAVERHFREMGHDMESTPFTVAGIGDMSGDVFGNAMLLSKQIKLVAAFNHRHIFLDPTPDPASSFKERTRLFHLKGSGWNDYDTALLSKGGGIFDRTLKSITLTREMQTALGTDAKRASPDELIQIILKAPVDLLWNGGIGTYVKSAAESHEDVGDRANNALRIDGHELRCKIVGEGGNLGFTQRGRMEYARAGGRINTDAIDNSAGVDCSDHEVNLKIALGAAMQSGKLTLKDRNKLLKSMTDDVAHLVLEDNRLQTQALSLAEAQGVAIIDPAQSFMHALEAEDFLNRAVEFLPSDKELADFKGQRIGLTRPSLSVLLAYSKLAFARDLKKSDALDAPYYEADLIAYFPAAVQKRYQPEILKHRLRRDIVATVITNQLINRLGFQFPLQMRTETGADAADIAAAYVLTRDAFGMDAHWTATEALDGKIPHALQLELFHAMQRFFESTMRWMLDHLPRPIKLDAFAKLYSDPIKHIHKHWRTIADPSLVNRLEAKAATWATAGVPANLATAIATLEVQTSACAIIAASGAKKLAVEKVAAIYFAVGSALDFDRLRARLSLLPTDTAWARQAVSAALTQLAQTQQEIVMETLLNYGISDDAPAQWLRNNDAAFKRYQRFLVDLFTAETLDASMLVVALREVALLTD